MLNTIPTETEEAARMSKNRLEIGNQAAFRLRGEEWSAQELISTGCCFEWTIAINVGSCDSDLSCTYASRRNLFQFSYYIYCLFLTRKRNIVKYCVNTTNKPYSPEPKPCVESSIQVAVGLESHCLPLKWQA